MVRISHSSQSDPYFLQKAMGSSAVTITLVALAILGLFVAQSGFLSCPAIPAAVLPFKIVIAGTGLLFVVNLGWIAVKLHRSPGEQPQVPSLSSDRRDLVEQPATAPPQQPALYEEPPPRGQSSAAGAQRRRGLGRLTLGGKRSEKYFPQTEQEIAVVRCLLAWLTQSEKLGSEGLYRLASSEGQIVALERELRKRIRKSKDLYEAVNGIVSQQLQEKHLDETTILAVNVMKRFLRKGQAMISQDEWERSKAGVSDFNPENTEHVMQVWKAFYAILEGSRKTLFEELIAHLRAVDQAQSARSGNKMDADQLGKMFAPVLFEQKTAGASATDLALMHTAAVGITSQGSFVTILIGSALSR